MPLPDEHHRGSTPAGAGRGVVEAHQSRRGRRPPPDRAQPAHAALGELALVPHGDVEALERGERAACSASQAGDFTLEGTVASLRASQPAPPTATARTISGARSSASSKPVSTTRATGRCSRPVGAPVEDERAEHHADHERLQAAVGSSGRDRRGHARPGPSRRGPAWRRPGAGRRAAARRRRRRTPATAGRRRQRQHRHLADGPRGAALLQVRRAGRAAGLRERVGVGVDDRAARRPGSTAYASAVLPRIALGGSALRANSGGET